MPKAYIKKYCKVGKGGCGRSRPMHCYHKNPNNLDGYSNICGSCINKKHAIQKARMEIAAATDGECRSLLYKFMGVNVEVACRLISRNRKK